MQNQNKTPQKLRSDPVGSAVGCRNPRSPRTPSQTVGENGMTLRGSPFHSPAEKSLVVETPKKSPLKGILKTPMKNLLDCVSPNGAWLRSPNGRTPKKSVTWSPSPRKRLSENPINVPESPMFTKRCSPRLLTPGKNSSPEERNVSKTPDKVPQRKSKASPGTMPRTLEILGNVDPEISQSITRSGKMRRTLSLPCKITEKSREFASIDSQESDSGPFPLCASPLKPNIQTPVKSPSLTHRMCTRSGRTPVKESSSPPNKSRGVVGSSPSPRKGLSAAKLSASPFSGPPRSHIRHQSSSPTSNMGEFPQDNKMIGQNEINHGKQKRRHLQTPSSLIALNSALPQMMKALIYLRPQWWTPNSQGALRWTSLSQGNPLDPQRFSNLRENKPPPPFPRQAKAMAFVKLQTGANEKRKHVLDTPREHQRSPPQEQGELLHVERSPLLNHLLMKWRWRCSRQACLS